MLFATIEICLQIHVIVIRTACCQILIGIFRIVFFLTQLNCIGLAINQIVALSIVLG